VDELVPGPSHNKNYQALHDGDKFLVQKYAIAVTPSLSLIDPKPLDRSQEPKIILAGLSESVQGFSALGAVRKELTAIQSLYGGEMLIDNQFTVENFENALRNTDASIVHIASHGSFTGDQGGNFLLTYDGKLSMDHLRQSIGITKFRENPVDLLVLSACQTAAGDDRAALGLAGVAIKAGARSAMGSLWLISDEGTAFLIEEFYKQLKNPAVSKAKALQQAQIRLIERGAFQHPFFWSPYLMINDWL